MYDVWGGTFQYIFIVTKDKSELLYQDLIAKFEKLGLSTRICIVEGLEHLPPLDDWAELHGQNVGTECILPPSYLVVIDDMFAEKDLSMLDQYSTRGRKKHISFGFLAQGYTSKNDAFKMLKQSMDYIVLHRGNANNTIQQVCINYPCGLGTKQMKDLYSQVEGDRFLFIDKPRSYANVQTIENFMGPNGVTFDNKLIN